MMNILQNFGVTVVLKRDLKEAEEDIEKRCKRDWEEIEKDIEKTARDWKYIEKR